MIDVDHRQRIDAALLSFIAGFVDTCVFVGLFGLFTAHITGNLALIGTALVHREADVFAKLLSFPVFIATVALTVQVAYWLKRAGWPRLTPLLCVEAALLVMTSIVAWTGPMTRADDPLPLAVGAIAAAAMGLQNALMRLELTALPSTSVMTTNVTQLIVDGVTVIARHIDSAAEVKQLADAKRRLYRTWPAVAAFTIGAAGGAFGYAGAGFASLAVPAVGCLVLAYRLRSN